MHEPFAPASDRVSPFRDDPAIADIVAHPSWCDVRAAALHAASRPGLTLILGEAGTGKTLMLRDLERTLSSSGRNVCRHTADVDVRRAAEIILIDGADHLPAGVLAAFAAGKQACVAAGSSDLLAQMAGRRRQPLVLVLQPLPPVEAAAFLRAQVARSGQSKLLGEDAVAAVVQASAGIPHRLQLLTGLAIFLARLSDSPRVTAAHVAEAGLIRDDTTLHGGDAAPEDAETDANLLPGEALRLAGATHRGRAARVAASVAVLTLGGAVAAAIAVLPRPSSMEQLRSAIASLTKPSANVGPRTIEPHLAAAMPVAPHAPDPDVAGPPSSDAALADPPSSLDPTVAPSASPMPARLADAAPEPPAKVASPPTPSALALLTQWPAPEPAATLLPPLRPVAEPRPVVPAVEAPEPPLPARPELRVLVSYARDDASAEQRANGLAGAVHRLGPATVTVRTVPAPPRGPGFVYFYAEDRDRAVDLARALGGNLGNAALARRVPVPPPIPGTIEITLDPGGPAIGAAFAPIPAERRTRPVRLAGVNERSTP